MNLAIYRCKITLIGSLLLALAACGGDGDGDSPFNPTLPDSAARITAANAMETAREAVDSIGETEIVNDTVTAARRANRGTGAVDLLRYATHRVIQRQFYAARSVSENCGPSSADGRITGEVDESGSRRSGVIRFQGCNIFGIVFSGRITFEGTFNATSGDYSADFNGQISVTFGSEPTVTLTFDSRQTGNVAGPYTLDALISLAGPPDFGFLLDTTAPISGNAFDDEVYDGTIIVYGANSTRLRLDVTDTDFVDIDLDDGSGTFADITEIDLDLL